MLCNRFVTLLTAINSFMPRENSSTNPKGRFSPIWRSMDLRSEDSELFPKIGIWIGNKLVLKLLRQSKV